MTLADFGLVLSAAGSVVALRALHYGVVKNRAQAKIIRSLIRRSNPTPIPQEIMRTPEEMVAVSRTLTQAASQITNENARLREMVAVRDKQIGELQTQILTDSNALDTAHEAMTSAAGTLTTAPTPPATPEAQPELTATT